MGSIPKGISGSRAAAIIGLSQYATPFSVWRDIQEDRQPGFNKKRGFSYEPFAGNPATEFGTAFEPAIIKLTQDILSQTITDQEGEYSLPGADFVTCHIDGKLDLKKLFEGKTANFRAFGSQWGEPGTDRLPQIYQCQFQHNLMCSGLDSGVMSVLVFPATVDDFTESGWKAHYDSINDVHFLKNHKTDVIRDPLQWAETLAELGFFHQYFIEAKPDAQKLLKEMYLDFWNKYILTETPPEIVDYDDLKRIFIAPKGTLIIDEKVKIGGECVAGIMREFKDIGREIGKAGFLSKRRDFIKLQVLKFAAEQSTVADDESQEKIVFRDIAGNKLGSFDGKTFRS